MRKKAIYVIATVVLFPILEKAGVECSQRGFVPAGAWLLSAAGILKLALLGLLPVLLIDVSRPTLKRKAICVLVLALMFPLLQKAGIEGIQHGWAVAGSCLTSLAFILKPTFLILLVILLVLVSRLPPNSHVQALAAFSFGAIFFLVGGLPLVSGRLILNASRPTSPRMFMRDQAAVKELAGLANEIIRAGRITWIGNSQYRFLFTIRCTKADYRFSSAYIPKDHNFSQPVDAEDLSKVRHSDFSFLDKALQPTEKVVLDPNDYVFCRRASESIRRIGFDSVELYPEPNVVEFQIRDGMGRDNGIRYIYCYSPARTLPDEFMYDQQLDTDWYFARQPRFAD